MTKKSLTIAFVERTKSPAAGQIEHFDKGFPGLALRVSYAGGKSFGFYYRFAGKLRRLTFGTYPAIGLMEAREAWRAARISVARGIDPGAKETVSRHDIFADVVSEWIKRDKATLKASTVRQIENTLAFDVLPAWGQKRVHHVSKRDVIELLDKIADRAPAQARIVYNHLSGLFTWCLGRDIVAVSPLKGIKRPPAGEDRDRVLTDDELVKVWNASSPDPFGGVVRLLMLTGARREEIRQLKWSEVELDMIKLAGERTKSGQPHTIPLSAPARALISEQPKLGEYVFGAKPVTGFSRAKEHLDAAAEIEPWRVHDIRRTVATGLQKLGVNLQVTEAVLGHVSGSRAGIVGVYQRHTYDAEKRSALEAWGAHVMGLIEGRAPGKVLPMVRTA